MEEQYKLFDKVISTTLINFMIEDNRNNGLAFETFNPKNYNHLYAFEVALILSHSIKKAFYLEMGLVDYLKFKIKNWSMRKSFKRYAGHISVIKLELDKILEYMKEELSLKDGIYKEIYQQYYEAGIKGRGILRKHK